MHKNKHISAIRYMDDIDVYLTSSTYKLTHFSASPKTNWQYKSEVLAFDCISRCASMRHNDEIDVYFINTNGTLVHISCGKHSNWQHQVKQIYWNLRNVNPTCIRNGDDIDVYCVNKNGSVVHLQANPKTDWKYKSQIIFNGNVESIYAIRTLPQALDFYFISNQKIYHGTVGNHSDWKYQIKIIFDDFPVNNIDLVATRFEDDIDVFFAGMDGTLHQVFAGPHTKWNYHYKIISDGQCKTNHSFHVVRFGNNFDLYFIGKDEKIYHSYFGQSNQWNWNNPQKLTNQSAHMAITAVRPQQKAIDVFFSNKNNQMRNLWIGEGTGGLWNVYGGSTYYIGSNLLSKPIVRWEDIINQCQMIGKGWHGDCYRWKNTDWVVKKFRKQHNLQMIKNEVRILDKLSSLYPNLCGFQLTENGNTVGFMIKYFKGVSPDKLYLDKNNVFYDDAAKRYNMVLKIRQAIKQIQKQGICHGDLTLCNVLVHQPFIKSQKISVMIIDFGNSILFENGTKSNWILTGYNWCKPPQARHNKWYDPSGVNAYMFGRLALHILAKKPSIQIDQTDNNPDLQIQKLKKKFGYPAPVVQYIRSFLDSNPKNREKALFIQPKIMQHQPMFLKKIYERHQIRSIKQKMQQPLFQKISQKIDSIKSIDEFADYIGIDAQVIQPLFDVNNRYELNHSMYDKQYDNGNIMYIYHASCGKGLKNNLLYTLNQEASFAFLKFLNKNNKKTIFPMDINLLKTGIQMQLGAYTGVQVYSALIQGELSVFDIRLGIGVSEGQGFEDDSYGFSMGGFGWKVGRKNGIQFAGTYLYLDLVRLLHDDQSGKTDIVKEGIYFLCPVLHIAKLIYGVARDISSDGRQIYVCINNVTKYTWKLDYVFFQNGRHFGKDKPQDFVKPGEHCKFSVCKKGGFYGVQGYVSYKLIQTDFHAIFYYSNPYGGFKGWSDNCRILFELMHDDKWDQLNRSEIFTQCTARVHSSRKIICDNHSLELKSRFMIQSRESSSALFIVYNEYFETLIDFKIFYKLF